MNYEVSNKTDLILGEVTESFGAREFVDGLAWDHVGQAALDRL